MFIRRKLMKIKAWFVILLLVLFLIPTIVEAKKKQFDLKNIEKPVDFSSKPVDNTTLTAIRAGSFITPDAAVIYQAPPTFEWLQGVCSDNNSCKATLYEIKEGKNLHLDKKEEIKEDSLTYKDNLKAGTHYMLELETPAYSTIEKGSIENQLSIGDKNPPAIAFYVMSDQEKKAIEEQLKAINETDEDEKLVSEMNIFIENKVWYDAIDRLNKLISRNPDNDELKSFKSDLYKMTRESQNADKNSLDNQN